MTDKIKERLALPWRVKVIEWDDGRTSWNILTANGHQIGKGDTFSQEIAEAIVTAVNGYDESVEDVIDLQETVDLNIKAHKSGAKREIKLIEQFEVAEKFINNLANQTDNIEDPNCQYENGINFERETVRESAKATIKSLDKIAEINATFVEINPNIDELVGKCLDDVVDVLNAHNIGMYRQAESIIADVILKTVALFTGNGPVKFTGNGPMSDETIAKLKKDIESIRR